MKSRWSKVIKSDEEGIAIEPFEMMEHFTPWQLDRHVEERLSKSEVEEVELPHDCSLLQQQAYEVGRQAGTEEGKAQLRTETETERQRVSDLVAQVGMARLAAIQQAEKDITCLALGIAKKVIHREARIDQDVVANQVRQALDFLSTTIGVRIRAHPDDVCHLETIRSTFANREGESVSIQLQSDQTIQRGGCLIETDTLFIDATIDRQLEVIQAGLAEDDPQDGVD